MVRPDDEADDADGDHRIGHPEIAEDRLFREGRDDVADDAEGRQDHDVDFGVAEEPEQVLEQDRIAAAGRIEEGGAEVAVRQQHGDGAGQDGQRQQQQEAGDELRPGEQRHLVQRHARGAHVEDGGDEVDGAEQRGRAGDVQRKDQEVHGRAGMAELGRERGIDGPAAAEAVGARRAFHEQRGEREDERGRQQPEGDVVDAREGGVRRADHQRGEIVAVATDERGHHHEEDHDEAVAGGEHVEGLRILEDLETRLLQLHADGNGEGAAHDPRHDGEDQVHHADVLVVGGEDPAPPSGGDVGIVGVAVAVAVGAFVVMAVGDCLGGHSRFPRVPGAGAPTLCATSPLEPARPSAARGNVAGPHGADPLKISARSRRRRGCRRRPACPRHPSPRRTWPWPERPRR